MAPLLHTSLRGIVVSQFRVNVATCLEPRNTTTVIAISGILSSYHRMQMSYLACGGTVPMFQYDVS